MEIKKFGAMLAISAAFGLVACGDDDSSSSPQSKGDESLVEKTVTGVCEKGSFVKGAKITVYELDPVTYEKTGKTIKGEVKDNKGNYSLEVEATSPYVLMEVTGKYINEVTGEVSKDEITLRSMTNLKDRSSANINVVTSMRYDRQKELIESGEMSFDEAAKQAGEEVLKVFGIEGDVGDAEDLSLSQAAKGDSALLKISATVASAGDEASIKEFIEDLSSDIKKDGSVDGKDLKKDVQKKLDNWDEIVADVKDAEKDVEKKMAESSDSKDDGKKAEEKKDDSKDDGKAAEEKKDDSKDDGKAAEEKKDDSKDDGKAVEEKKDDSKDDGKDVEEKKDDSKDDGKDVEEKKDDTKDDGKAAEEKKDDTKDDGKDVEEKKDDSGESKDDPPSDNPVVEPVVVEDPVAAEPVYWIGSSGKNSFNTGLDNGSGTSGIWMAAPDYDNDGESTLEMVGTDPSERFVLTFEPGREVPNFVVEQCQGVCGTYSLKQGRTGSAGDPYVKAYFNVAGVDDEGHVETADASSWDGICITYTSPSIAPVIELYSSQEESEALQWDVPVYNLMRKSVESETCLAWNQFSQQGWGEPVASEDFVKNLGSVVIKFKSRTSGLTGDFSISKLTSYTIKTRK